MKRSSVVEGHQKWVALQAPLARNPALTVQHEDTLRTGIDYQDKRRIWTLHTLWNYAGFLHKQESTFIVSG